MFVQKNIIFDQFSWLQSNFKHCKESFWRKDLISCSISNMCVRPKKIQCFQPILFTMFVIFPRIRTTEIFWQADHQFSESFYFIKISYVLTELWIIFYLDLCFLSKKFHSQLKQLYMNGDVHVCKIWSYYLPGHSINKNHEAARKT